MAGYPQFELDRQLCFALYAASRAMTRAYGPFLADGKRLIPSSG
jgi:MarR family transcriptional regulator, organic hydroperoxide resistance regulator